jgi:hypothetical protein
MAGLAEAAGDVKQQTMAARLLLRVAADARGSAAVNAVSQMLGPTAVEPVVAAPGGVDAAEAAALADAVTSKLVGSGGGGGGAAAGASKPRATIKVRKGGTGGKGGKGGKDKEVDLAKMLLRVFKLQPSAFELLDCAGDLLAALVRAALRRLQGAGAASLDVVLKGAAPPLSVLADVLGSVRCCCCCCCCCCCRRRRWHRFSCDCRLLTPPVLLFHRRRPPACTPTV